MPALLSLVAIIRIEVTGIDRFSERFERRKSVSYARLCEFSAESRFVSADREAENVVLMRCNAGFAQQDIVGEEDGENRR